MGKGNNGNLKKREQTAARVIKAVKESSGLLTVAAQISGLGYRTVCRYVAEYPSCQAAVREAKEKMLDFAEGKLVGKIKAGDDTAIIFYLKTQGKARGYVERQEFTGQDGGPIKQETSNYAKFDAKEVARAILEAERLGLTPEAFRDNGHGEDAPVLSSPPDV